MKVSEDLRQKVFAEMAKCLNNVTYGDIVKWIDDNCNNMIEEIDLNEIIDVYEFSNYNPNFLDLHDYIHDDFHESAAYRITNIWNKWTLC